MPPKGSKKKTTKGSKKQGSQKEKKVIMPPLRLLPNPVGKGMHHRDAPPFWRGTGPSGTVTLAKSIWGIDTSALSEAFRIAARDGPDPKQFGGTAGAGGGSAQQTGGSAT
jgi:hypothetical protein